MEDDATIALSRGTDHRFADWPNAEVPNLRAGVYTIWNGERFLYWAWVDEDWLTARTSHPIPMR